MEQQILDEFEEYWTLLPVKDSEVYFVSELIRKKKSV